MKIGISSSYLGEFGIRAGAARMRAHGYDCVDFQWFADTETGFFKQSERDFERTLTDNRAAIEGEGITVSQTHGPWRHPTRDFTKEDRAERFESMAKAIRGTAYIGAPCCVIHPLMPFGSSSGEDPDFVREINLDHFSRLADIAKQYGVCIAYENMPFKKFPITTTDHILDIVKTVNHSALRVCLDVGHAIVCGESLYDAVHKIGKEHLAALHVHDNDGIGDYHYIPGEGIGDFDSLATALFEIGFEGSFSFETSVKRGELSDEEYEKKQIELANLAKKYARR